MSPVYLSTIPLPYLLSLVGVITIGTYNNELSSLRLTEGVITIGVTRLSRINGVIPPEMRGIFVDQAQALVTAPTHVEFTEYTRLII